MSYTFITSLLISCILVGIISAGVAWALSTWLPFLATFALAFGCIFATSFIINSHRERKIEESEAKVLADLDLIDTRNTVIIQCPCKQNEFEMQVYPNFDNHYECDVCKSKFFINVVIEPILQTTPINLDNAYQIFQTLHSAPVDIDESRTFWNQLKNEDSGT